MKKPLQIIATSVTSTILLLGIMTAAPVSVSGDSVDLSQTIISASAQENIIININSEPVANNVSSPATTANTMNNSPALSTKSNPPKSQSTSSVPAAAATNVANNSKAAAIIDSAKRYLGVKYVWGGTTPAGFDCSGFVGYVFAKQGITLPRVSRDQAKMGSAVAFANLKPGDLVFFSLASNGTIDHEGIYFGNGQFINASSSKGVAIYSMSQYWKTHYITARRVI